MKTINLHHLYATLDHLDPDSELHTTLRKTINLVKKARKKPKVIVHIGDGCIEKVTSNTEIDFTMVDYDIQYSNSERTLSVPYDETKKSFVEAVVDGLNPDVNPHLAQILSNLKN